MKYVVASESIPEKCGHSLQKLGFEIIALPKWHALQSPVASHADMLLFFCGNKYICSADYYNYAKSTFDKLNSLGYSPIISEEKLSPKYPNDIIFNSFILGGNIYGFEKTMSRHIKEYASQNSLKIRNVNQGYAKCSVCKVGDRAIITSDTSIAKAAAQDGADVLLIHSGNIELTGYDCGFIGGTCGDDGKNVYFCGNVSAHPDGDKIIGFCEKHGRKCISLSNDILFDVGSLFFV